MLGVGIDWAEDADQVAFGRPGEGVFEERTIPHRPEAVSRLIEQIGVLESDPTEVRVAIETKHGHLVEALLDAGYAVVPVNPQLVAKRRGPAKKKDDPEDAQILCRLALDRHLVPSPAHPTRGGRRRASLDRPRRRAGLQGRAAPAQPAPGRSSGCGSGSARFRQR